VRDVSPSSGAAAFDRMDAAKLEYNGKTGGGFDGATQIREILVESSPSQKRASERGGCTCICNQRFARMRAKVVMGSLKQ